MKPVKLLLMVMFTMVIGFGLASKISDSELPNQLDILALNTAVADGEEMDCWHCTEEWQGYTVPRDCCGYLPSCEVCFMTGDGCEVECVE